MDPLDVATAAPHKLMPLCERLGVEVDGAAVDRLVAKVTQTQAVLSG